jgi:GNAT superfamily N-acetyltransferase
MLSKLERILKDHGLHLQQETMNWEGEDIGYAYKIYHNQFECATLVITTCIEYSIQDTEQPIIHVRDIFVEKDYRHQGIARILLLYGLCHAIQNHPEIRYSDLEDDTDFPLDEPCNLYYPFGYRFKEGDPQEKWMDLQEFKKNIQEVFLTCKLKKIYTSIV